MYERVFVRWDNLTIEQAEGTRLPGYRDPATIRTFDAPEAIGTRFHEIHARSAINSVPKRSRMPFRFTINPYRGCSHACVYCVHPGTPVLRADGRTTPIGDVREDDWIVGTKRVGRYRRFTETRVEAHWWSRKSAFKIWLEDGTGLIASGDHRFLTRRGWKHVTGTEQGVNRRPHLTLNDEMLGSGQFVAPPEDTEDYRRGYLTGIVRGDGSIGTYSYSRPGRRRDVHHRFRLALVDLEALGRARVYLDLLGVRSFRFEFAAATSAHRPVQAIRTCAVNGVNMIRREIEWPRDVSIGWCKGFLAGIFDAEGSHSGCIRITNTDDEILDWTSSCLRRLGFDSVVEDRAMPNGLRSVRIRGGLPARLRFLHSVDPAITRKRVVTGEAIKNSARLRVVEIEPVGELDLVDITTGTEDFIANGVVSHNCFARPTHTYLDLNAREDFEREIIVKVNVPELVRAELRKPSWQGEHVALGTNTDPYQWVEGRYRLMEGIWEAMRDYANPCSILTKSPLLLRDIGLMKEISERTTFVANLSIPTLDEKAWRASEPHTPHPRKRIEAVAELGRAGIETGVLVAPLLPGINDSPAQVEELMGLLGEAGAGSVGGIGLHLRGEVRDIWFDWLRQYRPDLVSRYEDLFENGAYMRKDERQRLSKLIGARRPRRFRGGRERIGFRGRNGLAQPPAPEPAGEQGRLFGR